MAISTTQPQISFIASLVLSAANPTLEILAENEQNRDSFSNSEPWLPTESMNDFHSHNFKHIFDQLDAANFNQWQNLTFRSA